MVYYAKGGVWKNTEDEILKAAVMKYGLNQWARISSLLVRKSASQCKTRWYEWLDPSIKKTEWSREEEEKLLHLAKILPNQWRTIAPLVGRTAHQCLERYEKLLDMAQQKEEDYDPADDPRRLRPGEIDPNPESKPARPDPIDMDEDVKEMLQEARARLANTKGKKAKRKAREKQLEESKRISVLQKRRELKAGGINISTRRKLKKGEMDYANEIPFSREAPAGFFEPEASIDIVPDTFKPISLGQLEGKRKFEQEMEARERDAKRQKTRKEQNLPDAVKQINQMNDPKLFRKTVPLHLPAPQMSESELEELAKLRKNAEDDDDEDTVTSSLLSDYQQTPTPLHSGSKGPVRTPARQDTLLKQAQDIIALSTGATPLAGGENTPLHKSNITGSTPAPTNMATPNLLATPLRTPGARIGTSQYAHSTPVRDQLQINQSGQQIALLSEEKYKNAADAKKLDSLFSALPKPKMTYDFVLPDELIEASEKKDRVEDQADVEERKRQQAKEEEQRQFHLCSSVLQRSLPRCSMVPTMPNSMQTPADLIQAEMRTIVLHDHALYPFKPLEKSCSQIPSLEFDELSKDLLSTADALVNEEVTKIMSELNVTPESVEEEFLSVWEATHTSSSFLFSPSVNRFVPTSSMSKKEQIASLQSQFEMLRSRVTKEAAKAKKIEKKITVYNGGYESNCNALEQEIAQLYLDAEFAMTELQCFVPLKKKEEYSIQHRIGQWTEILSVQQEKEKTLQERYAALSKRMKVQ